MPEAARITDKVTHTLGLGGLLGGLIVGAIIGAAIVATGGAAAIAIAAAAATGASLGAGLLGFIGSFFQSPPTGAISLVGSPDVLIGRLRAARAVMDSADCSGPIPFIWPHPQEKIAEGSETVFVNGMNAARKGDKLVASAEIITGCDTVLIGGAPATLLEIGPEYPKWLDYGVMALGALGGFGLLRLGGMTALRAAFVLGAGFGGGYLGSIGAQWLARLAGLGETGQKIAGFIGGIVGGVIAGGAAYRAVRPRQPQLIPSAEAEALAYGSRIKAAGHRPGSAAAVVNRRNGKLYNDASGQKGLTDASGNPLSTDPPDPTLPFKKGDYRTVHPKLRNKYPRDSSGNVRSLEPHDIENCGEFKAANRALHDDPGAKIEDLNIHNVRPRRVGTDRPPELARCRNCEHTTRGATVTSD